MSKFDKVFSLLNDGDQIYIPGSSAEPRELVQALDKYSDQLPALHITNSFVPGINPLPLASMDNLITETVFFPRARQLLQNGSVHFLPLSYYGAKNYLDDQNFDWAFAHISPPDSDGNCSLGLSVEFMPTVLRQSKRVLGIINTRIPHMPGSPTIHVSQLDAQLEIDSPLVTYDVSDIDPTSSRIADHLMELIDAGSVLQLGLGNVPAKLTSRLSDLRNLRFHSGMLSDGFLALARCGALDPDFTHTTCCALGSKAFYEALDTVDKLNIRGVEETHAPANLARYESFIAVNSALKVDLWGQANLEMLGSKQISSVGGAADFSRAARNSPKGKSIIALPATASQGSVSRITHCLQPGQVTSLGRCDIDYVVTEYGIAELKGKSVIARAAALIKVAAPEFRDSLSAQCQDMLKKTQ